jgi:hypothetical protein
MKLDLNNVSMVATAVSGYLFVIITGGAWFRWWFRHNIKEIVAELKPNGGKSIKDTVNRIEKSSHISLRVVAVSIVALKEFIRRVIITEFKCDTCPHNRRL